MIGDALGGPVEFQDRAKVQAVAQPPKAWRDQEILDKHALEAAAARLRLRSYSDLRPLPEPYGHWSPDAPPGTVTDDSRHKLILLQALHRTEAAAAWPFDVRALARTYLEWPAHTALESRPDYQPLIHDWLEEWRFSARWVLGGRDQATCRPPERLWNGLPTCCGQMTLPPLAGIFAGQPVEAYRTAYHLAFFDNGWGRDLNAAWVAALATALTARVDSSLDHPRANDWEPVLAAMRGTDPYGYREVPWTQRSVDRWLDLAQRLAREADRRPARLFTALDEEFRHTIKWEAQVPFVVTFAVLELADYHPLAAIQLSIEWGHDTDSYAQMVGALVGALHGARLFPTHLSEPVRERLKLDYGEDLDSLVDLLMRLQERAPNERLFSDDRLR
jgi:ADP-ribosylglycohydrolase